MKWVDFVEKMVGLVLWLRGGKLFGAFLRGCFDLRAEEWVVMEDCQ